MQYVRFERQDRVGIVTMDYRRENRLNPDLLRELMQVLDEIERDAGTGAVVLTGGDPKFFSNGLDLEWLLAHVADMDAVLAYNKSVNAMFRRWTLFPKPTVAALNGHTFAAGLFLAAHLDFRFMRADRGWICLPEVDINIPLLPGMIAICQATMSSEGFRRLYYTGRRLTGPEAVAIGFVERACSAEELLPTCVELAAELAKKKPTTYAEMKRRLRHEIARLLDEEDPQHFRQVLAVAVAP